MEANWGILPQMEMVYFDTDCFHHFASTFQDRSLPDDLRRMILFSPITMLEVFSHLGRWGNSVYKQIQGLHNWIVLDHAGVLPWMNSAISAFAYGVLPEEDDYTNGLQEDINACMNSELSELLEQAKNRDAELQTFKQAQAVMFKNEIEHYRTREFSEAAFTERWAKAVVRRAEQQDGDSSLVVAQVIQKLSAVREFEYNKLKVALANSNYNVEKNRNDVLDADQLIYLADPTLHFLTVDGGYLNLVKTSPQRSRIHQLTVEELADHTKIESILRGILGQAAQPKFPN